MSRTMCGYVELYTSQRWEYVFATDTFLAGVNDHLMDRLFGSGPQDEPPFVAHHGRPEDASDEVRTMYDHVANDKYLRGDMVNAGWASFAELQPHADEILNEHAGWRILYRMMAPLAAHFGAERVRFIAWQLI